MIAEAKSKFQSKPMPILTSNNNKINPYVFSIKGFDCYPTQMFYKNKQASGDSKKPTI